MKRTAATLAILLALSLTVAGCGTKKQKETSKTQNQKTEQTSTQKQSQFSRPDMMGEIVSVQGNEITLKEIDTSQQRGNRAPGQRDGNQPPQPQQGQDKQGGQPQPTPQVQPGQPGPNGQEPRRQREVQYTGETKKITIPEGVSVTEMTRGQNGVEQKVVETKDLKAGDTLSIWYSDKEKGTISRISVRPKTDSNTVSKTDNKTDSKTDSKAQSK